MDEQPKQLIDEVRPPVVARDGTVREDFEYVRRGMCVAWMFVEPLAGWRTAHGVTDMRCGFQGLVAKVRTVLAVDPFIGHVFTFRGHRGDVIKCHQIVMVHGRRPVRACCCIVHVRTPSRPSLLGVAGPGLLAHILVSKFASHQPLYRQSMIYVRQGVEVDRSSMGRWVGACRALMAPLIDALRGHVMAYNAYTHNLDKSFLNRPLPSIDSEITKSKIPPRATRSRS